jgi:hypothetical protein
MATSLISKVIIEQALALLRIDNFLDKKDIIDDKLQIDHPLADHTKYDPKQLIKLLQDILSHADEDGGLRVYFGSRDDHHDNPLTLIYAPTHKKDAHNVFRDVGKYFIIDTDDFERPVDTDRAKSWVKRYKEVYLPVLQQHGLIETQVMFYNIATITELAKFIKDHGELKSSKVHFAAYLHKDGPVYNEV